MYLIAQSPNTAKIMAMAATVSASAIVVDSWLFGRDSTFAVKTIECDWVGSRSEVAVIVILPVPAAFVAKM